MNETTPDAWFYSRQGERLGPVTFDELRQMAKQAELNPRLDMVWKHGMDQWTPAGEIPGLFERRAEAEPAAEIAAEIAVTAAADPYTPPASEGAGEVDLSEQWPGARRRGYIFFVVLLPVLWNIATIFGATLTTRLVDPNIASLIIMAGSIVMLIIVIYFSLMRLVNLGMSRWWFLGSFVPLLNLWVGYRCFACPAGYAVHKKLDGAGIFLAIIYWLMIALVLLVIAAAIAMLAGALGSPEMREQLEEIMRGLETPPAAPAP